ncbi:MAG: M28 family peptidase, partial [Pseudomonadota bacterium]
MKDISEIYVFDSTQRSTESANGKDSLIFGNTTVELAVSGAQPARESIADARREVIADDSQLCVVTQKGRVFQNENPDIEVVLDRGRYLLVSIPSDKSGLITEYQQPCYSVEAVDAGRVVYERLDRPVTPESVPAETQQQLDRLKRHTFDSTMVTLTDIHSRFSTSDGYDQAGASCRGLLEGFGYETRIRRVDVPGLGASANVLARKPGITSPPKLLVTAHLDSINGPGGSTAVAPGADDNASGSSGVVALAEALSETEAANDTLFILFGGEEQGLHGSRQFIATGDDFDAASVTAVINMDMIGSINAASSGTDPTLSVLLEGGEISREIMDGLTSAAHHYTSLEVSRSFNPHNSDHEPFIRAGIPAVLTIEGEDSNNQFIHTA